MTTSKIYKKKYQKWRKIQGQTRSFGGQNDYFKGQRALKTGSNRVKIKDK